MVNDNLSTLHELCLTPHYIHIFMYDPRLLNHILYFRVIIKIQPIYNLIIKPITQFLYIISLILVNKNEKIPPMILTF